MKKKLLCGFLLLAVALCEAGCVPCPAAAEGPYLAAVSVESGDGVSLSPAPVEQWPGTMIRVSIDEEALAGKKGCLEAVVTLPVLPPDLYTVILSDGQRMTHGYFKILGPNQILVGFSSDEIRKFQCTEYCYLVFVTALRDLR